MERPAHGVPLPMSWCSARPRDIDTRRLQIDQRSVSGKRAHRRCGQGRT